MAVGRDRDLRERALTLAKPLAFFVGLLLLGGILITSCVARVDAAHVGIRVKLAGSNRGVDDIPVVTGWVFYNALTEQLVMFPTSVQTVVWTKSPHEGAPVDESITFSSSDGININADIGFSFHIEPNMAPHLYLKYKKPNLLELADGYIHNAVREAFTLEASQMPVQDIYGAGKGKLVAAVTKRLQDDLGKDGVMIDQLTINGALRLPENVANRINLSMEATQQAIQAENRVRQVKAEAEQAITEAEGKASAARATARGQADARLITAKAEAKANMILRYSTSPAVLQYRALERWNGRLPLMNGGGSLPMLTFDVAALGKEEGNLKALERLIGEDEQDEKAAAGEADKGGKKDADKADGKDDKAGAKDKK